MTRLWVIIVTSSVFGPYVIGSIRTEQVMVLFSSMAVLIFGWRRMLASKSVPPMPILILWLELLVVISISTAWPPSDLGGYVQLPIANALGAFVLPIALMLLTWFWTLLVSTRDLINVISRTIVIAMLFNTLLSVFQLITGNVAVVAILPRFWSNAPVNAGTSIPVAVLAAENGRFTGIFNQPAEAGIAYGIALFGLIFWVQVRDGRWNLLFVLGATCLCIGGILTISKIFLLAALPIAGLLILRDRRRRARALCWLGIMVASYWLLSASGTLPEWRNGDKMFSALTNPTGSLVRTLSAGRYGSGGSLGPLATNLLHLSPWIGFGAGGVDTPYDSMWIEALAVAGVFGAALVIIVLMVLFVRWSRLRSALLGPEWRFAGATLCLALGGSFGLPSLTGNRVSTLFWLTVGVLVVAQTRRSCRECFVLAGDYRGRSMPRIRSRQQEVPMNAADASYAAGPRR
jgi:hypothetical protein